MVKHHKYLHTHDDKPYVLVLYSLWFDTYNNISLPLKLQRSGKKEIKLHLSLRPIPLVKSWELLQSQTIRENGANVILDTKVGNKSETKQQT